MNSNVTPRNTKRITIEKDDKNTNPAKQNRLNERNERINTRTANNTGHAKKRLVKYDEDDIIFPIANGSDGSAYDAIVKPNGMSGTERFFSVPKDTKNTACVLQKYLEKFRGTNVCAAFWTNGQNKIEKCGILTDVGSDYISIKENKTNRLIIMNMDKVKYISVFCV